MACSITALSSVGTCNNDGGGIARSCMCKLADITAVTLTSGIITNFTMASTGLWKQLTYDKDDTAYFNQVGARRILQRKQRSLNLRALVLHT